jgi:hypothetical protein
MRLQQDLSVAISLFQDAFIKNPAMPKDAQKTAIQAMRNLQRSLSSKMALFAEQIQTLNKALADAEKLLPLQEQEECPSLE